MMELLLMAQLVNLRPQLKLKRITSTPSIPLKFRSDVTVELVKHSASDSDVVWAARVSTAGERSNTDAGKNQDASEHTGLINFLMRERHGTPFEHSMFTFYVSYVHAIQKLEL